MGASFERVPYRLPDLLVNDCWMRTTYQEIGHALRDTRGLSFLEVINHANNLQRSVIRAIAAIEPSVVDTTIRPISVEKAIRLQELINFNNGGIIVMRHGVQSVEDEERKKLQDPVRKIRLMQRPYNMNDQAGAQSLAEAASLALILKQLRPVGAPLDIITSRNYRAADVAALLSIGTGRNANFSDHLTCVNYPNDVPDEELDHRLGVGNKGSLVWEREIVNAVVGGNTFEEITHQMENLIAKRREAGLTIVVTHTPQMNAVDVMTGQNPVRVPELGFRFVGRTTTAHFPDNIFMKAA